MGKRNKLSQGWSHSTGFKRGKTTRVKDCISALPNDLLLYVLTRLTVKEAATTSTLSKRWRYLWRSHPSLDLRCLPRTMDPDTFQQTVNSILGQYNSPKLYELRIAGSLLGNSNSCINDWLSFAINKGASKLQLNLSLSPYLDHVLHRVSVHPFGAKHVKSLRHLSLASVNLSSEVFDIILTSCCNLEYFSLMYNNEPLSAKNTTPHQKLKSVKFYLCKGLEMVELWAPNLSSFDYHQGTRAICIKDCKQLISLRLTTGYFSRSMFCPKVFVSQFRSYLPHLESLIIAVHIFENESDFAELRLLSNLKRLALDVSTNKYQVPLAYKLAAFVLKTAPYLQLLEINIPLWINVYYDRGECEYKLPSMSLANLVELKLTGFRGDAYTMHFLSYILEYAQSLQKIDVTTLLHSRGGDDDFFCASPLREAEANICKEMELQLRQRMPTNVHLFFHLE